IDSERITSILPNETLESLKKMTYQKFIDIQEAWMNFDYDALSKLCTNELYNSYKTQLETLKLKKGQNIMSDFELLDAKVTRLIEDDQFITLTVYMKITF